MHIQVTDLAGWGRLRPAYAAWALGLLVLEIAIALWVHDDMIRPVGGDLLAPILLYCLLRGFTSLSSPAALATSLVVAYLLEALQYAQMLTHLGLQHVAVVRVVLGSHFSWADVLAYTVGALLAGLAEWVRRPGQG